MVAEWAELNPRRGGPWPSAVRGRACEARPNRRLARVRPAGDAGFVARPARARPPIGEDLSLFGFSRRSRSRLGARVFNLFFLLVFGSIFVQMIYTIVYP